jgi:hypothetical protein
MSEASSTSFKRHSECDDGPSVKRARYASPILDIPLLYHLAASAHNASAHHLQQAFLPPTISPTTTSSILLTDGSPYIRDLSAHKKCMDLLLLALDLLKLGLDQVLSIRERAAFACEYGVVGLKVVAAGYIDKDRLLADIQNFTRHGVSAQVGCL